MQTENHEVHSNPNDAMQIPLEELVINGFSPEIVTKVAAVLATSDRIDRDTLSEETGIHRERIYVLSRQLVKIGLTSEELVPSPIRGPQRKALVPTEKFQAYLSQKPEWQRATGIRKLAQELGKTEEETLDFLISLGKSTLTNTPDSP